MNEEKKPTQNKDRSTPYPGLNLADAIIATEKLRKAYGATTAYSRETVAEALGHQGVTGPASKKIAALTHFGLLNREGAVYRQSDIADRIFNNLTDEEKRLAIIEAFNKPALYQRLISDFDTKAVPTALDKVLIRNYTISEAGARSAAKNFIDSANHAGVLQHGVLNTKSASEDSPEIDDSNDNNDSTGSAERQGQQSQTITPTDNLTIEVPGTGIFVSFPSKYAFDMSIGAFTASIKQLQKDAETLDTNSTSKAEAPADDHTKA